MAYSHWDRLSAVDAAFLAVEGPNAHMHIGSITLFDARPLTRGGGGLDFERILAFVGAQLHKMPRFRQRLAYVPGFGQPGWIDDDTFNLLYHVRHTALPRPGDIRLLKRLAGRLMSQELDRGKPLWECWFVEGVEGERFAVISKLHHCMADGIAGRDSLAPLIGPDPDYEPGPPHEWVPRPVPSGARLLLDEIGRSLRLPLRLGRREGAAGSSSWKALGSPRQALSAVADALRQGLPSSTPLNVEIGPHRRLDWTRIDLTEAKDLRARAGGTVNDVVLALVTGALRRFLRRRGVSLDEVRFRVALPVSVRSEAEEGTYGNRVSGIVATLPLDEADPWRRLLRIVDTTHQLKASRQASGAAFFARLLEAVPFRLAIPLERWGARRTVVNLVVTNVPGPQVPLYMLGCPMLASYPVVPLAPTQALGVALYSYNGLLCFGLNSDWDALPDLHDFEEAIQLEFEALRKAALPGPGRSSAPGPSS